MKFEPKRALRATQSLLCVFWLFLVLRSNIPEDDNHHDILLDPTEPRRLLQHPQLLQQQPISTSLFQVSNFTVLGPTSFPKPTAILHDTPSSTFMRPHLTPTFGRHRPDQDAVLAFAAEYGLNTYLSFVTSLRKTGFVGDIVLAVATLDLRQPQVREFFQQEQQQDLGLVVYAIELKCFNAEQQQVESAKGGMRVCQVDGMYENEKGEAVPDPREPRTLATTRYELYWMWTLHYHKHSWLMLVDARDTYFQLNPFANLPREKDPNRPDGVLHFFGENIEATRIGKSPKNRKWLTNAYGDMVVSALEDKPTICSGSTMGEQVALETYLCAMVSESDETGTKLMGADQGFHNYLYYTNKLARAETIRSITVFDQGHGVINNLGAMRTKELEEWGNGKILQYVRDDDMTVLNWDGEPSPVVHQFDRHKILSTYVYKTLTNRYRREWQATRRKGR